MREDDLNIRQQWKKIDYVERRESGKTGLLSTYTEL